MADKKISQLTALSAANVASATDVLAIVDTSATETKKITAKDLIDGALNGGTANGVLYLNGSKVATSGSALVFDGTNLGLGVTPSAWGSSNKAFQISGGGAVWSPGTADTRLSNNQYRDASNARIYIANGAAHEYVQNSSGHAWLTAPSGTINTAISFTQAMTLDASGQLGIGTSSPTTRLDVVGGGDATTGIIGRISSNSSGAKSKIQYTDNATYNLTFGSDGSGNFVWATGEYPTNSGTERARISSDGTFRVKGAGTAGSTDAFQVSGSAPADAARITSGGFLLVGDTTHTDGSIFTATGFTPLNAYRISTTAAQGIFGCYSDTGGTKTVRAYFQVDGGLANYSANDVNLSDQRVKDNINPAGSYWNKIKALEIVTFRYKDQDENDQNIGVIAQQVETVAPEFVSNDGFGETPEGEEPLKTVYTTDMYHAAIKALQEAMARIELLEADVAALKGAK